MGMQSMSERIDKSYMVYPPKSITCQYQYCIESDDLALLCSDFWTFS